MQIRIFFLALSIVLPLSAEKIEIGTGSKSGVYYPTGKNICEIVNKTQDGLECSALSTKGSVFNINSIKDKKFQFAIAQSDTIFFAYNGQGSFKGIPYKKIRTIMTIYPELFTFIVNKSAAINKVHDINGKIISIGENGSGVRETVEMLFREAKPLKKEKMHSFEEYGRTKSQDLLVSGLIDGFFTIVGHPHSQINHLSQVSDIDIVEVSPQTCLAVKNILIKNPFFTLGKIPKGTYASVDHDVRSFGVKATLITSADTDYDTVATLISSIMDNFEEFKKLHPAYKNISKRDVVKGLGAPLHPAARDYLYKNSFL